MIVVTGASGYLGRALLAEIQPNECWLTAGRSTASERNRQLDLASNQGFREALVGARTVIHIGGLAHAQAEQAAYDQINVQASLALADAALTVGARHFIYVSSVAVLPADRAAGDRSALSLPRPATVYGASKWRAERGLETMLAHSACRLSIVRPALIYDRELTANLAALYRLAIQFPVSLPSTGARTMVARRDVISVLRHLAFSDAKPGVSRYALTDGEVYTAQRIGRVLAPGISLALPSTVWRVMAALRDVVSGHHSGTTWRALAGAHWLGSACWPQGTGPRFTFDDSRPFTLAGSSQ